MPHRQPRNRHPQMLHRQLAGGPFTRAGHQRTYGGLGLAGVSPDGIPLVLHDSIDATAARSARAGPRPATCTVRFRVLSLPVLFEQVRPIRRSRRPISPRFRSIGATRFSGWTHVRGDWPDPWTWRTRFPGTQAAPARSSVRRC